MLLFHHHHRHHPPTSSILFIIIIMIIMEYASIIQRRFIKKKINYLNKFVIYYERIDFGFGVDGSLPPYSIYYTLYSQRVYASILRHD